MMNRPSPLQPGDLIRVPGNYFKVVRHLGSGGMGAVYLVNDANLDKLVVVKVLHAYLAIERPDLVQGTQQEARAISKLKHPNVVAVTALGRVLSTAGEPYYVMDHVDGESIRSLLGRVKVLRPSRALHVGYQILAGLMHMHEHGIIHADMKPDNVILCDENQAWLIAKIIDFGVIVLLANPPPPGFRGTYTYASPEQLAGNTPTERCDVWAVAMFLYEMIAGVRPFAEYGEGRAGAMARIGKRVRSLRDYGLDEVHLDTFFEKALNPTRDERYGTAFEMWRAVGTIRKLYEGKDPKPSEVTTDNRPQDGVPEAPRHITAAELAGPTRPDAKPFEWDHPFPYEPPSASEATKPPSKHEREALVSTDRDGLHVVTSLAAQTSERAQPPRRVATDLPSAPPARREGPLPFAYVEPAPAPAPVAEDPPARRVVEAKTVESGPPAFDDHHAVPAAPRVAGGAARRPRPMHEREGVVFASRADNMKAWLSRSPRWFGALVFVFVASAFALVVALLMRPSGEALSGTSEGSAATGVAVASTPAATPQKLSPSIGVVVPSAASPVSSTAVAAATTASANHATSTTRPTSPSASHARPSSGVDAAASTSPAASVYHDPDYLHGDPLLTKP
ncbi:hypothetical protein BH09MYX1_BH09MYX1_31250 [soil metagenome]